MSNRKPSHGERLARIEERTMIQAAMAEETRDEIRRFRHDLFSIINPMNDKISSHDTAIKWITRLIWVGVPTLAGGIVKVVFFHGG